MRELQGVEIGGERVGVGHGGGSSGGASSSSSSKPKGVKEANSRPTWRVWRECLVVGLWQTLSLRGTT